MHKVTLARVILFFSLCITKTIAQQAPLSTEHSGHPLLEPDRFDATFSGVTEVDFHQVRKTLLGMESQLDNLSKLQQAYYFYHLAISSREVKLRSDKVFPHLDKALTFRPSLSMQQQFQMLVKAKDLAMDYRLHDKALAYLAQLRTMLPAPTSDKFNYDHAVLDYAYARALSGKQEHTEAIALLAELIIKADNADFPPEESWLRQLAYELELTHAFDEAVKLRQRVIRLYPSDENQFRLVSLQKSKTNYQIARQEQDSKDSQGE